MSVVTDVILTTPLDGDSLLPEINAFFGDSGVAMYQVDKPKGSPGKAIQANIFVGAFNYFDIEPFVAHLRSVPWSKAYNVNPECVRLFVQEESDDYGFHEVLIWEVEPDPARTTHGGGAGSR